MKKQLVKLGSTNPELRPHIQEVLKALEKTGSSKDLHQYLVEAHTNFLRDVEKVSKRQTGNRIKYTVHAATSSGRTTYLKAVGTDRSDFSIEAFVYLVVKGAQTKVVCEFDSAYHGKFQDDFTVATGNLTPAMVASHLMEYLG